MVNSVNGNVNVRVKFNMLIVGVIILFVVEIFINKKLMIGFVYENEIKDRVNVIRKIFNKLLVCFVLLFIVLFYFEGRVSLNVLKKEVVNIISIK